MIGERIRDKFAASRARGMWMGGKMPLGYDVVARKLVVNGPEAARVRRVFKIFAETRSSIETVNRLRVKGVTSKSDRTLDKGDVYKLLHNRTYVGEAPHKGQYASISEIAAADGLERDYLGTLLRLTLLAPDIIMAFLDCGQTDASLARLMQPIPTSWTEQRDLFGSQLIHEQSGQA